MPDPILDPKFWLRRLKEAKHQHEAIFKCNPDLWQAIEKKHTKILEQYIRPTDSILDVGCGWGRLLTMMPDDWYGDYTGIDVASKFLMMARENYPSRRFVNCQVIHAANRLACRFDWAVMVSFRPMILKNLGDEYWQKAEEVLKGMSGKRLYLEYDLQHEGSIE